MTNHWRRDEQRWGRNAFTKIKNKKQQQQQQQLQRRIKRRREVDRPTGIHQIGRLCNQLPSQGENNLPAPLTCHRPVLEWGDFNSVKKNIAFLTP